MYNFIRTQYRMRKITAAQVWAAADDGKITAAQAMTICGPRPND